MPISTFNQAPYFDDYNVEDKNDNNKTVVDKNYLRILFQPGFAVQTRELNQLQSSLQNQIEQLGNHFFTEGSAIFGDDKPIFNDGLHYVDIIPNSAAPTGLVDLLKLQGKITDIGTEATVVNVEAFTENNVDKIRLYVTYDQGGEFEVPDADDGLNSPLGNDALYFVEGEYVDSLNTVNEFAGHVGIIDATGYGFSFSIRENVYYTNGSFVHFPDTSLFLRKAEGEIVKSELRFIVSENKVNSTQDSTLLDNANGSSNFSAPGADRYQIVLRPIIVVPNDENGVALRNLNGGANSTIVFLEDDSNIGVTKRLLTVGEGGVKEESTNAFNDFDKKAAKRTAEESGNYVLQPFRITYENFIREENPAINGYYTEPFIIEQSPFGISTAEDARQHYIVEVNTSIAYVNGFRYTYPPKVILKGVRARTFETITDGLELSMNYGHYVEVDRVDSPSATLSFTPAQIANIKSVTEIGTTQRIHTFQNEDVGQTLDNVSNPTLLFKLPFPGVKSVGGFEYERVSRFTNVTIQETNKLIINSSGGNFSETSAISTPAYGVFDANGKLLNPSYDFTILVSESTASTVKLQLNDTSAFTPPFTILAPEDVPDVIVRTKTQQSGDTAVNVTSTSEETILTLTNSDVIFSEDKVNLTIELDTNPGVNVSGAKFRVIDDGQKKDRYTRPVIGISGLSSTGAHTVKYNYFSHTSGDYFASNSYDNAFGSYGDYSSIPTLDFLENTSLADVIDFRIKEIADDQDDNASKQAIPRPNSTAKITNLEAYESRIDKLIINDGGTLEIFQGEPAREPVPPIPPKNSLTLYEMFVPYYTSVLPGIRNQYFDNSRYTMRQIGQIDKRLQQIEYTSALNSAESSANNRLFTDADGNTLFKSAFIADNFSGHSVGDLKAPDYLVAVDRKNKEARPYYKQKNFRFFYQFAPAPTVAEQEDNLIENVESVADPANTYTLNESDHVVDTRTTKIPEELLITLGDGSTKVLPLRYNSLYYTYFSDPVDGESYFRATVLPPWGSGNTYGWLRKSRYRANQTDEQLQDFVKNYHRGLLNLFSRNYTHITNKFDENENNFIVIIQEFTNNTVSGKGPGTTWFNRRFRRRHHWLGSHRFFHGQNAADQAIWITQDGVANPNNFTATPALSTAMQGSTFYEASRHNSNITVGRIFSPVATETKIAVTGKSPLAAAKKSDVVDGASTAEVLSLWEGTTEELFKQPALSNTINLQPFEVTNYEGHVTLSPSSDEWIDSEQRPAVTINNNGAMDAIEFLQDNNLVNFEGVLGTDWNSWQTTSQSVDVNRTVQLQQTFFTNHRGQRRTNNRSTTTTNTTITTQQSRTGTNTTLGFDTIEQDLGERIVDLNIVPFIRSRDISFKATGLKPGTQHYIFFDGDDVTRYCAPTGGQFLRYSETDNVNTFNGQGEPNTTAANYVGPISASSFNAYTAPLSSTLTQGDLTGTFRIPNNNSLRFKTGIKDFKITSSPNNNDNEADSLAQCQYHANGLLSAKERVIMSTRTPELIQTEVQESRTTTQRNTTVQVQFGGAAWRAWIRRGDPIAQTFLINEDDYEHGVFLSDVDLYFAEKPGANIDVEIYIVPTDNGIPTSDVVPGSRSVKSNSEIIVSGREPTNPAAQILPTKFKFERPLHLKSGVEYAMVVFSNSIDYRVWTSVLGKKDLLTDNTITTNSSIGVLLKSQNKRTWTPDQYRDLTFVMNKCVFPVGDKAFQFKTSVGDNLNGVDQFDFSLFNVNEESLKLSGTNVKHDIEFTNPNNNVINGVFNGVETRTNVPLRSAISSATVINSTVTLSTDDRNITPMFDLERYSILGVNNTTTGPRTTTNTQIAAASDEEGYVTQLVDVLNPSSTFRATIQVFKPATTSDVKVFVNFDDAKGTDGNREYTHIPVTTANGVKTDLIPVTDVARDEFVDVEFEFTPATKFETMRIKVVFEAADSAKVCRIKNFAGFALI
jgi:hypothetical protein